MKNVQIRNVPDSTHAVLRKRAVQAGLSLQEYLLEEITSLAQRPTVAELVERISRRRGGKAGLRTVTKILRDERSRH